MKMRKSLLWTQVEIDEGIALLKAHPKSQVIDFHEGLFDRKFFYDQLRYAQKAILRPKVYNTATSHGQIAFILL